MQIMFYKWCLQRYQEQHKWIAFIDADEYFETTGNETLREVLESFDDDERIGAVGVNVSFLISLSAAGHKYLTPLISGKRIPRMVSSPALTQSVNPSQNALSISAQVHKPA
jgi:hypothetical protein